MAVNHGNIFAYTTKYDMFRLTLAICAFAACTTALAQPTPSEIKAFNIAKAKERVADEHSDPDSAKFRRMFLSHMPNAKGETQIYLCGEVNVKNKMGGYGGYREFFVDSTKAMVNPAAESEDSMAGVRQQMFNMAHPRACANKLQDVK